MKKLILTFMMLGMFSVSGFASTLAQMLEDLRFSINDTTTTSHSPRYTDTFLTYRLNEEQKEIARATFPIYTSKLIDGVTSQTEYTVSTDTAKIDKVTYWSVPTSTDSYRRLIYATIRQLDKLKGLTWESLPAGTPTHYYTRSNVIGIVPPLSSTYAVSDAIKVYYYKSPSDLVNSTDIPFDGLYNMVDFHRLLVLGVGIRCKKEMGKPWQDDKAEYNGMLLRMQNDLSTLRPDSSVIDVRRNNYR